MTYMGKEKFINDIADAAVRDWKERHICLPSIIIALAIEGSKWGKRPEALFCNELFPHRRDGCMERHDSFMAAIRSHNNYLAAWRENGQTAANWRDLIGQNYYILAVQYLQGAEYPYCDEDDYERNIVGVIEEYGLNEYDKE